MLWKRAIGEEAPAMRVVKYFFVRQFNMSSLSMASCIILLSSYSLLSIFLQIVDSSEGKFTLNLID